MTLISTTGLALLAGLSIPLGALVSAHKGLESFCYHHEIDSFVSYFGGGALLAAIALVLVPYGMEHATVPMAAIAFLVGSITFWQLSSRLNRKSNTASQFLGMLLDYFPESIALGTAVATGSSSVYLLVVLIALQNMPEGFASFHEMRDSLSKRRLWAVFLLVPLLGPLAAWLGYSCLSGSTQVVASLMLFCSGGILYLIFEDIVPHAHLKNRDFPAIGAVLGFLLGMMGAMLIH